MSLISALQAEPQRFEFVQTVRLLKQLGHQNIELQAEIMPVAPDLQVSRVELVADKAKITLCIEALSGAKGVIPHYIYEELLSGLHSENDALKQFLDVFNLRVFELDLKLRNRSWLLLQEENAKNTLQPRISETLAKLSAINSRYVPGTELLKYSLLLGLKSRNLRDLSQLLQDYFGYQLQIQIKPPEKHSLPQNSLTTLGCSNNRLGQGLLLGSHCQIANSHISITLQPASREEFIAIKQAKHLAKAIKEVSSLFLRDETKVSVYQEVKRSYLLNPILSSKPELAAKLGEVDYLAPHRIPEHRVKLLLK